MHKLSLHKQNQNKKMATDKIKTKKGNDVEHVGLRLQQVYQLKQRNNNRALKPLGLTYMQFAVLDGILEMRENGIVTQQTIVSERALDKSMVSTILRNLISRRLVLREELAEDTRYKTIELTKAGEQLTLAAKKIIFAQNDMLFNGIEKEALNEILLKILSNKK